MALNSLAITSAVAALSIPGMTVLDVSGIPNQVQVRDCPIMYPAPVGLVRGKSADESSRGAATFGTPTTRYWVFGRTYNYTYLHAPVGAGRGLYEHFSAMLTAQDAIMTALTALDVDTVDVAGIEISAMSGTMKDPAESSFYGFSVALTMRERLNQ